MVTPKGSMSTEGEMVVRLTTLPPSCAVVVKSGNLNFLEPTGPLQACNGTALPLPLFCFPHIYHSPHHELFIFYAHELVCFVMYCYKTKYWIYMCKSISCPTCRLRSNVSLVGVNQGWHSVLCIFVEKLNTRHVIKLNEWVYSLFEQ